MRLNLALSNRLKKYSGEDENVKRKLCKKVNLNGARDDAYVGGNN